MAFNSFEVGSRNPTPYILHPTPHTSHPTPHSPHPTPHTLNPTPDTLHPTPRTKHPTPYTPHPTPHTPHPTPHTPHTTHHTPHLTPFTLHPTPYTPHHTPYNSRCVSCTGVPALNALRGHARSQVRSCPESIVRSLFTGSTSKGNQSHLHTRCCLVHTRRDRAVFVSGRAKKKSNFKKYRRWY